MFREQIKHIQGLDVQCFVENVESEYFHWHDDLEIMLILEGCVTVRIGPDLYELKKNDVLLIDSEDIHKIEGVDEDNIVLFVHLDVERLERVYPNINYMCFVCDAFDINSIMKQEVLKGKVEWLKTYMCEMMYEKIEEKDGYLKRIKEITNDCILLLMDEFRTLAIEDNVPRNTKKSDEDRLYRILRYMYDDYKEHITLEEVSEKEYLNKYYISRLIKENMGLSFRNMLNYIRIEEAAKLLISTDKTITDIAYETAFSKVRYFNECFAKLYGCTPSDFRMKEQNINITRDGLKQYKSYDKDGILSLLSEHAENVSRGNSEKSLTNIHKVITIEVSKRGSKHKKLPQNAILINDAERFIFLLDNDQFIEELKEVNCNTIILANLWVDVKNEVLSQYVLDRLEKCYKLNFELVIHMKKLSQISEDVLIKNLNILKNKGCEYIFKNLTINKFLHSDNEINALIDKLKESIGYKFGIENIKILTKLNEASVNECPMDTEGNFNWIINNYYKGERDAFHAFGDSLGQRNGSIIFNNKLKSPVYYMYFLLSCIPGEITEKGEDYLITQDDENINVLFYNFIHEKEPRKMKKVKLKFEGIKGTYRYTLYSMADKTCYDYWNDLGRPLTLKKQHCDLINSKTAPDIEFKILEVGEKEEFQINLDLNRISLVMLERIEK